MKAILFCFLALGLVCAEIDLSKEQTLYEISEDKCTSIGLTGIANGTATFTPTDGGVKIVGSNSLGNQTLTCSTTKFSEFPFEDDNTKNIFQDFTEGLTTLNNRLYFYSCKGTEQSYTVIVLSSQPGSFLLINESCELTFNTVKEVNVSEFVRSSQITKTKENCTGEVEFSGNFSVSNIVEVSEDKSKSYSLDLMTESIYFPETKKNYTNVTSKCEFERVGSMITIYGCEGNDSEGQKVLFDYQTIYATFEGETVFLYEGTEDEYCWFAAEVLGSSLLKVASIGGLLLVLLSFLLR